MARKKNRQQPFDLQSFLARQSVGTKMLVLEKGQRLFSQGDKARDVFFIQSGRVKVSVLSKNAKEAVVAILGGGTSLGKIV